MTWDPFADVDAEIKGKITTPDLGESTEIDFLTTIEKHYGPMIPQLVTGATIRAHCRFCRGRGCLNCDTLTDRAYQQQWPQGPQPLLTIDTTTSTGRGHMQMLLDPVVLRALMQGLDSHEARLLLEEAERCAMWDAAHRQITLLDALATHAGKRPVRETPRSQEGTTRG